MTNSAADAGAKIWTYIKICVETFSLNRYLPFLLILVQVRQELLRDGLLAPHGPGPPQPREADAAQLPGVWQAVPPGGLAPSAQPRPSSRQPKAVGLPPPALQQAIRQRGEIAEPPADSSRSPSWLQGGGRGRLRLLRVWGHVQVI